MTLLIAVADVFVNREFGVHLPSFQHTAWPQKRSMFEYVPPFQNLTRGSVTMSDTCNDGVGREVCGGGIS